jgi:hypothetical protein
VFRFLNTQQINDYLSSVAARCLFDLTSNAAASTTEQNQQYSNEQYEHNQQQWREWLQQQQQQNQQQQQQCSIGDYQYAMPYFYSIQPPIVNIFYTKLNKSACPPLALGDNKFALRLPFKIAIKPGRQKDIALHLALFFPLHCNTIFRPCKELMTEHQHNVHMSLLNIIDGSVFIEDFVIRIRNLSQSTTLFFPRKTTLFTVKLQNVTGQIQPTKIKQLIYTYSSDDTNGSVIPIF